MNWKEVVALNAIQSVDKGRLWGQEARWVSGFILPWIYWALEVFPPLDSASNSQSRRLSLISSKSQDLVIGSPIAAGMKPVTQALCILESQVWGLTQDLTMIEHAGALSLAISPETLQSACHLHAIYTVSAIVGHLEVICFKGHMRICVDYMHIVPFYISDLSSQRFLCLRKSLQPIPCGYERMSIKCILLRVHWNSRYSGAIGILQ